MSFVHSLSAALTLAVSTRFVSWRQTLHTISRSFPISMPLSADIGIRGANDRTGKRNLTLSFIASISFGTPLRRSVLLRTMMTPLPRRTMRSAIFLSCSVIPSWISTIRSTTSASSMVFIARLTE